MATMTARTWFMVRRFGLRRYVLAAIFGTGVAALGPLGSSGEAAPLDPAAFSSLGPSPFDVGGPFLINTSSIPQLTGGNPPITPIAGVVTPGNIAVFTFDSISIPSGASISVGGSRPVALLSQTTVLMLGRIGVVAAGGAGADGVGSDAGGGAGGGGAANGVGGGGGGGFGGVGGAGAGTGAGVGGIVYGNLQTLLQGGSGGGGGEGGPGGDGGGAIELGAADQMLLAGELRADGAPSPTNNFFDPTVGGGGGSGGGILIHAPSLIVDGVLSAVGGEGGLSGFSAPGGGGGGGGGGRVVILAAPNGLTLNPGLVVLVQGASGGFAPNSGAGSRGATGESGSFVTGLLPGTPPTAPVVAGCVELQAAPLVGATVKLKQGKSQSAVTDTSGCFSFLNVTSGRTGSITIELPTLP
jgi:hypothetical protein